MFYLSILYTYQDHTRYQAWKTSRKETSSNNEIILPPIPLVIYKGGGGVLDPGLLEGLWLEVPI